MRSRLAVVLLSLGGCNVVFSKDPWFTVADAEGAPTLRDGVWVQVDEPDCRFREELPIERWPGCAQAIVVRGTEWLGLDRNTRGDRTTFRWDGDTVVLANGEPLMLQVRMRKEDDPEGAAFVYLAVRPTAVGANGKATALDMWVTLCGPPADTSEEASRNGEAEQSGGYVTKSPFPGLTVVDNDCTADSVRSLRNAAALSETLGDHIAMHWVRDGWR